MARRTAPQASFDDQLVLFRYFLHELKLDSLGALSDKLNSTEYEGVDESGNTYFYTYIARICQMKGDAEGAKVHYLESFRPLQHRLRQDLEGP